jgi:hypothetical protein
MSLCVDSITLLSFITELDGNGPPVPELFLAGGGVVPS